MLEPVVKNFSEDLLKFHQTMINTKDLNDKITFLQDTYCVVMDSTMRAFLAQSYLLYRMYMVVKTRGVPITDFLKVELNNMLQEMMNEGPESEARSLISNSTHLKYQNARFRILIGGKLVHPFIMQEYEKYINNPNYEMESAVSYGITQKALLALCKIEDENERVDEFRTLLITGDAYGKQTAAQIEQAPKPEWYEKIKTVEDICTKFKYLLQHDMVEIIKYGTTKVEMPKFVTIKIKEKNND